MRDAEAPTAGGPPPASAGSRPAATAGSPPSAAIAAPPAIEARDLVKTFTHGSTSLTVLAGVTLTLRAGETAAITGPSGSGKSTLLHILGTLERPTAGELRLAGEDPFALPERALARLRNERIGFVFQDHHLLPQYTVLENVLLPALAFGRVDAAREARGRALLERVGLAGRAAHRPAELSGGERQRAAIARALLLAPRLLLCDEPTGQLDARTATAIVDLLLELQAGDGAAGAGASTRDSPPSGAAGTPAPAPALVVVTHNAAVAARLGRRFELVDGRCCEA
jgi:lipoprotein-releasing system ATP-binding protein